MMDPAASRVRALDPTLLIFSIIVLAAVLTWLVPPGAFERTEIEVPGAGTREVVVPGSYARVDRGDDSVGGRVLHSVGMVFKAPILGFIDEDAAPIIAFVLFIGGAFSVLTGSGAVDAGLRRLVAVAERSPTLEAMLIPLFMTLFSLGGAVFGMAEETIPFVLIFVPLSLALGYDSLTGAAIPFLGAAAGFASAFFNPFTVGVAQGLAGVPVFSGVGFRIVLWLVTTSTVVAFVVWHARRVRRDPSRSPAYAADQDARRALPDVEGARFTGRHKAVLGLFVAGLVVLVWGVLPSEATYTVGGRSVVVRGLSAWLGGDPWYIVEIAALFIALGVGMAALAGMSPNEAARAFTKGIRDLAPTAAIIGLARGILIVLQDGQTIDTILNGLASTLEGSGATVAAFSMFSVQTVINFFVPSGSGQAALTIPLMAPLADLVGVTRQTAVLAFQLGDGFTNMIVPTSPVVMGALSLARIPWTTWARWVLPLQAVLFGVGLCALAIAVAVGF